MAVWFDYDDMLRYFGGYWCIRCFYGFYGICKPQLNLAGRCVYCQQRLWKNRNYRNTETPHFAYAEWKNRNDPDGDFYWGNFLLSSFLPSPAVLAIIIVISHNLSDDADLCPSRIILPAAALSTLWVSRIPFGMGAVYFTRINAFIEPYGEQYSIGMFEPFKVAIVPLLVCSLYTILCYKLLPRQKVERPKETTAQALGSSMSRKDEIITYIVFAAMMLCMLLNKITGNLMYVVPAACALILCFTKTITVEEAKKTLSGDLIFMLAGIYVLSDALSSTGAGEMIGNVILSLMGDVSSPFMLCVVFIGATLIVTNLMSNMATFNMVIPLAVSTALAAGIEPGPLATAVAIASTCALVLPCSSGESAMAYAASGYNMGRTFKFTIPFVLLFYISILASMMIFYY